MSSHNKDISTITRNTSSTPYPPTLTLFSDHPFSCSHPFSLFPPLPILYTCMFPSYNVPVAVEESLVLCTSGVIHGCNYSPSGDAEVWMSRVLVPPTT